MSTAKTDENPNPPLADAAGSVIEALEDMMRACGSGMNWMEQVDRARLSSATRGILHVDMGMCSAAIFKARKLVEALKAQSPNVDLSHTPSQPK